MQTCSSCDGWGKIFYSNCCGEKIVNNKCTDCGDASFKMYEKCEECNGDGEVEI
jgi:DnaJ-class molecular chaperone